MRIRREIVIEGNGAFPIDMLRYDSCYPATEDDATKIAKTFAVHELWTIRLAQYSLEENEHPWSFERWASFNCYKCQSRFGR